MKPRIILLLGLSVALRAMAGEAAFAEKPTVLAAEKGARIAFSLAAPADVEVAILDKQETPIRHLAAGVLGAAKPPPEPLQPGLAQTLQWDGNDDFGKPAQGGPFKVRVRAGTSAHFGACIGEAGVLESAVYGLATDEKGNLFAATGGGYGKNLFTIKVFDRDGKYLRTIFPFPANLKAEHVAGFARAARNEKRPSEAQEAVSDGRLKPPQFNALLPWLYPEALGGLIGNKVHDGVLWLTDGAGRLCRINAADGACIAWGAGKPLAPPAAGPICWAIAPGGKSLFLAGWHKPEKEPDGQIFRFDAASGERATFIKLDVPADSYWLTEKNGWYNYTNWGRKNGFSALHGLAVDKEGRVFVCDRVNGRLAVYDSNAKLLGSTQVEHPDHVGLSSKGEIYVTTRKIIDGYKAKNEITLLKLSGWNDGKVLAKLTLPGSNAPCVAMDASRDPAVLWLSNVDPQLLSSGGITRVEDRGAEFVVTGKIGAKADAADVPVPVKVWADPLSSDVIVSNGWSELHRFNGLTGEKQPFPLKGMDLAFGPEGSYYVYGQAGWHELVTRFDRAFKPLPFPATGKNTTTLATTGKDVYGRYGHGWSNKGLYVGADGRIYVYNMFDWTKYFINAWDANGQAEKHTAVADGLIGPLDGRGGGVAVDLKGNIYAGVHGFPKDHAGGRATEGCVVKFGPDGGGCVAAAGEKAGIAWRGNRAGNFMEGALRAYVGISPQVQEGCECKEGRFDIDLFGRLYIPSALDYRVRVLDNEGNEIVTFGHYGNADSRGPESAVPDPPIALGWPMSVSADRKGHIYVADTLNHRVARVDVRYAVESVVEVGK